MLSRQTVSAMIWIGTAASLISWWIVSTQVPQQQWPIIFPLAACVLLALNVARKSAGS
jgi:hypothetical protein